MSANKKVSSRDVAREAGVSQATVSYILNNTKGVSIRPETKAAVLAAVKKLNYHPNEIARGMKLNRTMSIGVVTDRNVTNFNFIKTLEGIRDGLQLYNYSVTLLFNKQQDENTDPEYIRYYNSNRIDGIIFAFASLDDETVNYLNSRKIPFIVVDAIKSDQDVYSVCTDHLNRLSFVIGYFKSKGVHRIGYIGAKAGKLANRRLFAFKEAMAECGLEVYAELIATSGYDDNEILNTMRNFLSRIDKPEAVISGTPRFGLFAVKCAQLLNIKVPDELKIISLGNSNFYNASFPSISAVELPLYGMGSRAAEMLFELINGRTIEKTAVLASEAVFRDSC